MSTVCYFVYNLGGYSGAALQALNLAKHVSANVVIFNIGKAYLESAPRKNIEVINMPSSFLLAGLRLIYEFFVRSRISIVHLHGQFLLPMLLARIAGAPYIVKTTLIGDDDFDSLSSRSFGRIRLYLVKCATLNVAPTQQLLNINKRHIPAEKIKLIPNGVEIPGEFLPESSRRNDFYFSGIVSKRKNTLAAIKFFEKHYAPLENARLFVIGPNEPCGLGREYDKEYINRCKSYIAEKGLEGQVIFTGLLKQHEAQSIASKCKALLFFSEHEGLPNVVLEAMAANCVPIISSLQGAAREIVGESGGFVIPDDHPPSIHEINNAIKQERPRARAVDKFSFGRISVLYDELYECLQAKRQ